MGKVRRAAILKCWVETAAAIVIIVLGIGMVAFQSYDFWKPSGHVFTIYDVKVDTPVVEAGGTLRVQYLSSHHRLCKTEIRGWLLSDANIRVHSYPVLVGGYTPIQSRVWVAVERPIPEWLLPGAYKYFARLISECPGGEVYVAETPEAHFRVPFPGIPFQ